MTNSYRQKCCLWSSINGGKGNRCMYLCSGSVAAEQSEQLRKLTTVLLGLAHAAPAHD